MIESPIAIIASSAFANSNAADGSSLVRGLRDEVLDIDEEFFQIFQNKVRRASRFVKFANFAAHCALRQVRPQDLPPGKLGLFLGTSLGNAPDVISFAGEILANANGPISPGCFVNTVSNAGLFYVARELETECITAVVSQESLSFEAALLSATQFLRWGGGEVALVGGVDVYVGPPKAAATRMHASVPVDRFGEGAGFILLAKQPAADVPVLGYLTGVGMRGEGTALEIPEQDFLALGMDHSQSDLAEFGARWQRPVFDYSAWSGRFPTASAFAACRFLRSAGLGSTLYHSNAQRNGPSGWFRISKMKADA